MRPFAAIGVVVAGVLLGGACGTQDETQSLETLSVPLDRACLGGQTKPVQIEELILVFRRHGLEMFDDPECLSTESARQASNAPDFGPNPRRADAFDEVKEAQGYVFCGLLESPGNPLQPVKEIKYEGDEETSFVFANVRCTIYPDEDSEWEQLKRLRRAASALARITAENE